MAQSGKNLLLQQNQNQDVAQGIMTVTDDEIIELLREQNDPAYNTSEIADMVGMTTDGVRNRLEDLRKAGRICRKDSSRRCTMWWLPKYDEISDYPRSAHSPPE